MTNEERAHNASLPLVQNNLLTKAAELKANDMATRGYFAHTSPDGKTPWYWLEQVGYKYSAAGENLAVNFFESADVARAWMNSPSHRDNILKKGYTEIGIGIANGMYQGRNTVFVAQFFGTPLKTAILPSATTPIPPKIINTPTPTPKPTTVATKTVPKVTLVLPTIAPMNTQVLGEETIVHSPIQISPMTQLKLYVKEILASPREYVSYIFGTIIFLFVLALLFVLYVKSEMAHPLQIARGMTMVAIVLVLLFINMKVARFDTKISDEGAAVIVAY